MRYGIRFQLGLLNALFFALVTTGCGNSDADQGDWTHFEPELGRFSLRAPGEMLEVHSAGAADMTYSLKTPSLTYTISYSDTRLPPDATPDQINKLLDAEVSAMPIEEDCKIVVPSKIMEVAHEPGCQVEVELKDKSHRRIQMVVFQGRLFRLEVTGTSEAVFSADADRFFSKFELSH